MSSCEKWLAILACASVALICAPGLGLSAMAQEASNKTPEHTIAVREAKSARQADIDELPDSPGSGLGQEKAQAILEVARSQPPADDAAFRQGVPDQTGTSSAPPDQSTNNPAPPQRPVGTAAAEASTTTGIAASEPAGVAIAPAKQHRARTIIIRTGAIIGAAVALGVVVGLTEATSSKPPGAH